MKCLLCNAASGYITRAGDDTFRLECPSCGGYEFGSDFAELTKQARVRHDQAALRTFKELGRAVRHASQPVTLHASSIAALLRPAFTPPEHA